MSQFGPKDGGVGRRVVVATPKGQFRPRYDNLFRTDLRPAAQEAARKKQREGMCIGNDDTCGARRAKGTEYCAGHLRSLGLLEVKGDEGRADHSDPQPDGS